MANHFVRVPVTLVCDSWFENYVLFKPLRKPSLSYGSFTTFE